MVVLKIIYVFLDFYMLENNKSNVTVLFVMEVKCCSKKRRM